MADDLQHLLEENLRLTREVHTMVRTVKRHLFWQRVITSIYLLILIAPVILAIIYLPSIIRPFLRQYQEIFGAPSPSESSGFLPSVSALSNDRQLLDLLREATGQPPSP